MPILAFDTSMRSISVAVACGDHVVGRLERGEVPPAERLLPLLREVLSEAQTTLPQVKRIAVTLGPGGFTGIRVGLAMAQGLRRAIGCELVASGSLQVMAHVARGQLAAEHAGRTIVIAVPAGRGGMYVQMFTAQAHALNDVRLVAPEHEMPLPADAVVVGPGAADVSTRLSGRWSTALADLQPEAATLVRLAPHLTPVAALRPMYISPADATPAAGPVLR